MSWVRSSLLVSGISRRLLVLARLVREPLPRPVQSRQLYLETTLRLNLRRKLPQLMSHHLLRYIHFLIALPIMHCKSQTDEIRKDGSSAFLCSNWRGAWRRRIGFG